MLFYQKYLGYAVAVGRNDCGSYKVIKSDGKKAKFHNVDQDTPELEQIKLSEIPLKVQNKLAEGLERLGYANHLLS